MADKSGEGEPRPKIVDMRAEPDDDDGTARDEARLDHVMLPTGRPPMNALTSSSWKQELTEEEEAEGRRILEKAEVTILDPRLEELEPLIGRGDWSSIADKLGPFDNAGTLPPQLGLIYAIAVNETQLVRTGAISPRSEGHNATDLALRCVASMCGVPGSSGFALVIAKRLLRKNPTTLRQQVMPVRRSSPITPVVMLLVGVAVGWALHRILHL